MLTFRGGRSAILEPKSYSFSTLQQLPHHWILTSDLIDDDARQPAHSHSASESSRVAFLWNPYGLQHRSHFLSLHNFIFHSLCFNSIMCLRYSVPTKVSSTWTVRTSGQVVVDQIVVMEIEQRICGDVQSGSAVKTVASGEQELTHRKPRVIHASLLTWSCKAITRSTFVFPCASNFSLTTATTCTLHQLETDEWAENKVWQKQSPSRSPAYESLHVPCNSSMVKWTRTCFSCDGILLSNNMVQSTHEERTETQVRQTDEGKPSRYMIGSVAQEELAQWKRMTSETRGHLREVIQCN